MLYGAAKVAAERSARERAAFAAMVLELREAGIPDLEIAQALGLPWHYYRQKIKKVGLPVPPTREELEWAAFVEERTFFRSIGWDDRRIAEKLGIDWETYRSKFRRHPELGPIKDPVEEEKKIASGWTTILRKHHHRTPRQGVRDELEGQMESAGS